VASAASPLERRLVILLVAGFVLFSLVFTIVLMVMAR